MVEQSPLAPDDIAAAVLAGIDAGEELIVPDEPARDAVAQARRPGGVRRGDAQQTARLNG